MTMTGKSYGEPCAACGDEGHHVDHAEQTTAQTALDHARRGRRVLIVTDRAVIASDVIERVSEALTPVDLEGAVVARRAGAWSVRLASGGRIDARPLSSSHALRGLSADTVITTSRLLSIASELIGRITVTSSDPTLLLRREL